MTTKSSVISSEVRAKLFFFYICRGLMQELYISTEKNRFLISKFCTPFTHLVNVRICFKCSTFICTNQRTLNLRQTDEVCF